ncbi:MAG: phosphatase PAP2 family protein [Promethearchaeota archaeon]
MLEKLKGSIIIKLLLIVIIPWIILAVIFGIFDLEISIAIVDENSTWGNFGADYGETPGWGLILIALAILIGTLSKNIKKQKIGGFLSIIIGIIYFIYYLIDGDQKRVNDGAGMIVAVVIFLIFTFNKDWNDYKKMATIILILAIINPLIFVQISKFLCGRVRFRDLALDYSNYTPWFLPPGLSGNKSFPSGHAAMGCMLLPLLIIVNDREFKDPLRIFLTMVVIGWGFFVGLSRVVVGAHFLSDILFSTGVAAVTTIILYKIFYLNRE